MILRLDIQNYAIIDTVSIQFSRGLNIITGETGSGKSILLGALGLILGNRADTTVLSDKKSKCIIEGLFDIGNYDLTTFFKDADLDYVDQTIIRREINPAGKSRAFVNDSPVSLRLLQQLAASLVDLHEQFENLGINHAEHQIGMIDALAKVGALKNDYQKLYQDHLLLAKEIDQLKSEHVEAIRQRDYVQFQFNELLDCQIDLDQDGHLEAKLHEMEHAADIIRTMNNLSNALETRDGAIVHQLMTLQSELASISKIHSDAEDLETRLRTTTVELQDIAQEASQIGERIEHQPDKITVIRDRLDTLNHLMHKHHVDDLAGLQSIQEKFDVQLQSFDSLEEDISAKEKDREAISQKLLKKAEKLSSQRRSVIPSFEQEVNRLLVQLRMEHARFKVDIDVQDELNQHGVDRVSYLFAPNKGSAFSPIKKVASGGEISRLSLITKSLVAGSLQMPTLIFDEIDSGVSGDVAQKMGNILRKLSEVHQIISITHSPQVAAKGSSHFRVLKETVNELTRAKVVTLKDHERIEEIATMLSSSPPSDAALTSAKELIDG